MGRAHSWTGSQWDGDTIGQGHNETEWTGVGIQWVWAQWDGSQWVGGTICGPPASNVVFTVKLKSVFAGGML